MRSSDLLILIFHPFFSRLSAALVLLAAPLSNTDAELQCHNKFFCVRVLVDGTEAEAAGPINQDKFGPLETATTTTTGGGIIN